VVGNISNLILTRNKQLEASKEKLEDLKVFLEHYEVPKNLQEQVFHFYSHMLQKKFSENDDKILSEFPEALQKELSIYMRVKLISTIPLFHDCSLNCLKKVSTKLKKVYFAPGEQIIKQGEIGHEMYIIDHGEVEVIIDEKVIAKVSHGQCTGEIALLLDVARGADVIAKTYCDLYRFEKNDFLEISNEHPELKSSFEKIMRKRSIDKK
jgi:voltage-gated potassium channel